jgi:NAD-dependent SIR2 family protein deacetylase
LKENLTWEEIIDLCNRTTKARCVDCGSEGSHTDVFAMHRSGLGYYCRTCGDPDHHLKETIECG